MSAPNLGPMLLHALNAMTACWCSTQGDMRLPSPGFTLAELTRELEDLHGTDYGEAAVRAALDDMRATGMVEVVRAGTDILYHVGS